MLHITLTAVGKNGQVYAEPFYEVMMTHHSKKPSIVWSQLGLTEKILNLTESIRVTFKKSKTENWPIFAKFYIQQTAYTE